MWSLHDDVIKWKHFPRYWPFVRGIHLSPVESPNKGQWLEVLMFFICASTNDWANNWDVGDLRRHRPHYDVIVMNDQPFDITHKSTIYFMKYVRGLLWHGSDFIWFIYPIFAMRNVRFKYKDPLPMYRESHYKDKTAERPSYLVNGTTCSAQNTSLFWNAPKVFFLCVVTNCLS